MRLEHIHRGVHAGLAYPVARLRGNHFDARIGLGRAIHKAAHALGGEVGGQAFDDGNLGFAAGLLVYPVGNLGAAAVLVVSRVGVHIRALKLGDGVEHNHRDAGLVGLLDAGNQRVQVDAANGDARHAAGNHVLHHGHLGGIVVLRRRGHDQQVVAIGLGNGGSALDAAGIEGAGHCRRQKADLGGQGRRAQKCQSQNQDKYLFHR